jgi:glycine cleavage system H protein
VKAASDIYAPVSGEVIEVNEALESSPELANSEPYGEGWFFRMRADNIEELDALLDAEGYEHSLDEE